MAPLKGSEAKNALERLRVSRNWTSDLSRMIPEEDARRLTERWVHVSDTSGFQKEVVKPFLESLMAQTTQGVSWNVAPSSMDRGMLFLSNHRDIVLDPSLVNVALLEHGRGSTEIGIGSNLLGSPWVSDLVRLNRCFVVERSGSARERYEHSQRTARYIRHVAQQDIPVWLAHREGRAKDGMDATAPALMRTLSDGCQAAVWNSLNVVPVSISYEWDPCDVLKVNELLHTEKTGKYQKAPGEDELSMWTGLVGQKGRVHLEFGQILRWEENEGSKKAERDMATSFDRHLMSGMKPWPNQGLAARHLGLDAAVVALADASNLEEEKAFQQRMCHVASQLESMGWSKEEAEKKWCQILAAPLTQRHALLEHAGHGNGPSN
jgi:1-acyl-sn-glycerol-3-phosphate acyltransferase